MTPFHSLYFNAEAVSRLIDLSRVSRHRECTFDQMFDPSCRRDGKRPAKGKTPTRDDVDPEKIGPGLWLVKDSGVYLMSNATEKELRSDIVYADGFDPTTTIFDSWWEAAIEIMGGDDQCILLTEAMVEAALSRAQGGRVEIAVRRDKGGQFVECVRT